jgi:hypothetical protein
MGISMGVLAVIVLVLGLLTHAFTFSPGKPDTSDMVQPTVDVHAELQAAAPQLKFPLYEPAVPGSWRPNSDSVTPLGQDNQFAELRVGWVTPDGGFLSLAQSNADTATLVKAETNAGGAVQPTGTQNVAGVTWTVYPGIRSEQAWTTDRNGTRLLITGSATPADFTTLATATQTAPHPG